MKTGKAYCKTGLCILAALVLASPYSIGGEAEQAYSSGVKLLREKGFEGIDAALAIFEQAIQADAGFEPGHQALADALILKYELSEKKDKAWLEKADEHLDKVLKLSPGSAKAYFSKATLCFDMGSEKDGDRYLGKALLADPSDGRTSLARLYRFLDRRENDRALSFAESSASRFAGQPEVLKLYGDAFSAAGMADAAVTYYSVAAEKEPGKAAFAVALADELKKKGEFRAASEQYAKVLKAEPANVQALFGRGYCEASLGNFADAASLTEKYVEKAHDDAAALNNLAMYYEKLDTKGKALAAWEKLLQIPSATDAHRSRAQEHIRSLKAQ